MSSIHFNRRAPIAILAFLGFVTALTAGPVRAELPAHLKSVHLDWVCVTDAALVEAYQPLAAHREAQGLASHVVALDEVFLWSPAGDDTIASLRWLAEVAYHQWGARYLLLGGSHALLPAPLHHLDYDPLDESHPIDSYYACLGGEWDVDGDGIYAEWGDDAADPTRHLCVGRVPADDAASVSNVVAKTIAFEQRDAGRTPRALFVTSAMTSVTHEYPYPYTAMLRCDALRDSMTAANPELATSILYQGPPPADPYNDPLQEVALADSLGAHPHDVVFLQLQGGDDAWQLVFPLTVTAASFEGLAHTGHGFVLSMISGPVGDTRETSVLQHLLTLPDGGAVAALAPSGMGYLLPHDHIQRLALPGLVSGAFARLGDAVCAALVTFAIDTELDSAAYASTYWCQDQWGDPALLLAPVGVAHTRETPRESTLQLAAAPNPFNPATELSFVVPGDASARRPVRVEILDPQGRRLTTLFAGELAGGPHTIPWTAAVPSGVYLARVTAGGAAQSIKVTLVE